MLLAFLPQQMNVKKRKKIEFCGQEIFQRIYSRPLAFYKLSAYYQLVVNATREEYIITSYWLLVKKRIFLEGQAKTFTFKVK